MEKIIVLDCETCGDVNNDDSFAYDLGFMVCDLNGNIYEKHSYVIADYFLDKGMMETAFYKDKVPSYWEDIKNGKRQLRKLSTIHFILKDVMTQYNITKVFAFNVRFDFNAMTNSQRLVTNSRFRYFFPYGTEICDIMSFARELAKEESYKEFCKSNGYVTKRNQSQVKAEVVYRYLFDDKFEEAHQGLQDCEIEFEILRELNKRYPNTEYHLVKED